MKKRKTGGKGRRAERRGRKRTKVHVVARVTRRTLPASVGLHDTKDRGGARGGSGRWGGISLIKWGANATPANI